MNNQTFKAGDKVYYPLMSDKILTLLKHGEDTVNVDLGVGNFFELNGKKISTSFGSKYLSCNSA